jgi:insertion element IS1 protein InsB
MEFEISHGYYMSVQPPSYKNEKKEPELHAVNPNICPYSHPEDVEVEIHQVDESELDEMWSFVKRKEQQRWLWHAIDHHKGTVLAYVCGTREDDVFLQLQTLLRPFGISRFYTDHAGVYQRHLSLGTHKVGKQHTQKIERKHLTLRTRIKRLARKTICFSKSIMMHDIVLGLFMNRYEFALPI